MRNIHFYLPRPNNKVNTIRFKFTLNNQKVTGTTKIKIESNNWDIKRVRCKPSHNNAIIINNTLRDIESKIVLILEDLMLNNILNKDSFISNYFSTKEKLSIDIDIFKFHETYFIPNKRIEGVTESTIKTHMKTVEVLNNYCIYANINRDKLSLKRIMELTFYYDYLNYLNQECGYMLNYQGALIKNLKTIINHARELGLHNQILSKNYKKPTEVIEPIILEKRELNLLENCKTLNVKESLARDWFVLSCYSGLRISDFLKLDLIQVDLKTNLINVRTNKNKSKIILIPIAHEFKKILIKYDNKLPPKISEAELNKHIKVACKKAKINSTIEIERKITGKQIKNVLKKHEKITAHCGRRTFATLAYEQGILALDELMIITGHSDVKTLKIYIRFDARKIAKKMQINMKKVGR
jgi:integrase